MNTQLVSASVVCACRCERIGFVKSISSSIVNELKVVNVLIVVLLIIFLLIVNIDGIMIVVCVVW